MVGQNSGQLWVQPDGFFCGLSGWTLSVIRSCHSPNRLHGRMFITFFECEGESTCSKTSCMMYPGITDYAVLSSCRSTQTAAIMFCSWRRIKCIRAEPSVAVCLGAPRARSAMFDWLASGPLAPPTAFSHFKGRASLGLVSERGHPTTFDLGLIKLAALVRYRALLTTKWSYTGVYLLLERIAY